MSRKTALRFDGSNDYSTRGSDLTGSADSKQWSASFWFKRKTLSTDQTILDSTDSGYKVEFDTSTNVLRISAENASDTDILYVESSAISDYDWHHVCWSFDMSDTSKRHLYIDGVSDLSVTTYTNDTIDFTKANHAIGFEVGDTNHFDGDLSELWVDFGTYIDLSDSSNLAKFIDSDGLAADLGSDGSTPTGSSPIIYTKNMATNLGTGGNYTITGALDDAVGPRMSFDYSSWSYYREIELDTTSSGADISTAQSNFPVLLRFDDSNFDFTHADTNGEDIRFENSDGTVPLDYEIERWDSTSELGEIWVNVPTLSGDDTTDIVMYYGKSSQSSESSGESTFQVDDGFQGVWHLGGSSPFLDSTINSNDGSNNNTSDTTGQIARGRLCNNDAGDDFDRVIVPSDSTLEGFTNLTMSAWFNKLDKSGQGFGRLISKRNGTSDDYALMHSYDAEGRFYIRVRNENDNRLQINTANDYTDDGWYHVAGTFEPSLGSNEVKLFVDGSNAAQDDHAGTSVYDADDNLTMGAHDVENASSPRNINGDIDEVRVENVARSADWIECCYENQKDSETLTTIGSEQEQASGIAQFIRTYRNRRT